MSAVKREEGQVWELVDFSGVWILCLRAKMHRGLSTLTSHSGPAPESPSIQVGPSPLRLSVY